MKLDPNEYVPFAPEVVGKRQRVNHSSPSCDGDSQSLSIWRNEDNTIGAKCYRCGATGRSGSKPSMFKKVVETKELQAFPTDIAHLYEHMPPEVATYCHAKGVTEKIAKFYGIGYSKQAGGLVLPVHNEMHHNGFQVKYFGRKQRYSTVHMGQRQLMFSHLYSGLKGVVIVEDLISAIRIKETISTYDAFALLGSELNDVGLSELVKNHTSFIIWLDNDNDIICGKAKDLFNRMALFGTARYMKYQVEPKDLSDQLILDALHR